MALLDKLNKQRQQQPAQAMGQTEAADRLLQAKSGKAGTTTAPVGTETERAIADQTKGAQRQASRQGVVQGVAAEQQAAGIKQQQSQTNTNIDIAREQLVSAAANKTADLQLRAVQAAEKLGLNKQQAAMEARLFERRLTDQKYIQELQQEAAVKRLQDQTKFKLEMQDQIFGDQLANLLRSQEFSSAINMNTREFDEWLNQLDAKDKWKLAVTAIKQKQTQDTINAFTGGLSAGSRYGGMIAGGGSKPTQTPTGTSTQYNQPSSTERLA